MTLAINTTDAFATGTIANTGLGNRGDKSFSTGFQGQLIQISSKERQEIDFREAGYDIWIWPHDSNCYPERCMGWTITDQIYWDSNEGSDNAIIMIDFDLILG